MLGPSDSEVQGIGQSQSFNQFQPPAPMQLGGSSMNLAGGQPMPRPQINGQLNTPVPFDQMAKQNNQPQSPPPQMSPEMTQVQKTMLGFMKTDEGQEMINNFHKAGGYDNYQNLILQAVGKAPPTSGTINPASQMMYNSGLASSPYSNSSPQNSPAQNKFDALQYASLLNNQNNNNQLP
jgi:hypothetical protein